MELVILDIDGTLADTARIDAHALTGALSDVLGIDGLSDDWSTYTSSTDPGIVAEVVRRVHGTADPDVLAAVERRFYERLEDAYVHDTASFIPVPGATTIFRTLREADLHSAIATGSWHDSALFKLRVTGIDREGLPMATADDADDRTAILSVAVSRALSLFGKSTVQSVLYIGDGPWDVEAARTLGFDFLGIGTGQQAEILTAAGAKRVLPDLRDVSTIIRHARRTASRSSNV